MVCGIAEYRCHSRCHTKCIPTTQDLLCFDQLSQYYLNISHSGPSHCLVSPCFTAGTATTALATALDAAASCALCAFGRCGWRCPLPPQMADRCYHATRLWARKNSGRREILRKVLGIFHCIPLLFGACYMFDLSKISKLEAELCVLQRIYGSKSTKQQSN